MSLKYAILGFLVDKSMHGYMLKKALSPGLRRDQLMNDGVLYPLLTKMEREGLLRKKIERGEKGTPNRHVYTVSAEGKKVFREWLDAPAFEDDDITYDFFLGHPFLYKCMFFKYLTKTEVQKKLKAQRESAEAKLENFYRIRKGMAERNVDAFRIAILDLGIAQQRDKILWLGKLLKKESRRKT